MFKKKDSLEIDETALVKNLRQEAQDVKDCFTKFSFQAIVYSSAILGLIIRFQENYPLIALTNVAVITLLLVLARIGTYKYFTANRNYGYELHLYRTMHIPDSNRGGWKKEMRDIGWEEAMRAWRVVQATQFDYLHVTTFMIPNFLKKHTVDEEQGEYRWFLPNKLVEKGATYYSGSYLRTMLLILYVIAFFSLVPLFVMTLQFKNPSSHWHHLSEEVNVTFWLFTIFVIMRILKTEIRRKILETGILSIHSCAIIWQATVVAHFRVLERLRNSNIKDHQFTYKNYTLYLSQQAQDLKKHIFRIHEWIDNTIRRSEDSENRR